MSEIQLHFALKVQDKEGNGRKLIQYSYISLHADAIHCLKENGSLPAFLQSELKEITDRTNILEQKVQSLKKLRKVANSIEQPQPSKTIRVRDH